MRLTTAYYKIKKRNLVLINNATYQRETLSERPIRQPLKAYLCKWCQLFLNWKRGAADVSHFILFNISDKDKPHIMFFFTILHKFSKCCFPIPFSALNSLTHFNTPKLRLAAKNIPFLQKTSTPPYVKKTTLFYAFCAHGCVASHVESEPPGLTCHCHEIYRDEAVGLKCCKYTLKITICVNMWNLGQFRENLIYCQ